jgi:hypothetical protein
MAEGQEVGSNNEESLS